MGDSPPAPRRALPSAVQDLARRCGASGDAGDGRQVVLTQTGVMRPSAGKPWAPFKARQTIAVERSQFTWRATTGPFGAVAITDALEETGAKLTVVALGFIPLARVAPDAALAKGELQRYLAELPLVPDAIVSNRALAWEVVDAQTLRVSAQACGVRAHVDLALGSDGLVASASAPDRPRLEGANTTERPWSGRFSDYRLHKGRRIPFCAEAAWTLDGQELVYWRGAMETWDMAAGR
jgi:hypothetical protein